MIINDILKQLSSFLRSHNDDIIDRFHNLYSVIGISIYVVILSSKQYYGEPLQCTIRNSINGDTAKFFHSMCWLHGTFKVTDKNDTLMDFKEKSPVRYYQWLPMILVLMITLYRIPMLIWKFMIYLNGFELSYVAKAIMSKFYLDEYHESSNWSKGQKAIESINDHLKMRFLKQKNYISRKFNLRPKIFMERKMPDGTQLNKSDYRKEFPNLKTKSVFPLLGPYLLVKILYLLNIGLNVLGLSYIFGFNYLTFGIDFTNILISQNETYFLNPYFPKRVICTTNLYSFQKENKNSEVCSLPINLFNEIFFYGYWFWLIILSFLSISSIFYWLLIYIKAYRRKIVLNALQIDPEKDINLSYTAAFYFGEEANHQLADSFLQEKTGYTLMENFELFFKHVCSPDVIFVIKMISLNSNSLAMRDLLNNLWDNYLDLEDLKLKGITHRPVNQVKRPLLMPPRIQERLNEEENSEA
ncbi:unnamed protein product [Brachionus calyciflorus]|uniref:Innexin n=1 Tax=Brachionus calyciflorus TaxID=104777 RepID=A0A813M852_9BILA|nr:unnamed protein product [Brachionus calyciflorus]